MQLSTETFHDVMVVHAPDELVEGVLQSFLKDQDRHKIVLDLDPSESLDSGALGEILEACDLVRAEAGDLRIATGNAVNRKILEVTRLDQQIETFDSVTDAVRSFDER